MVEVQRRNGIVGPLLLIGLGVVFLLDNLNLVTWNAWEFIVQLWPVLLIALGLDLVFGRRSALGSLIVIGITVMLLSVGTWFYLPRMWTSGTLSEKSISQSMEGATRAEVEIGGVVGTLRIDGSGIPETLVEGTIGQTEDEQVTREFRTAGETAYFRLASEGSRHIGFFNFRNEVDRTWDLHLSSAIPMQLTVNTGVGSSEIDLGELTLTGLVVNTGVGESVITLPGEGDFSASVDSGVGELTIRIPQNMEARIQVDRGLGDLSVPSRFTRDGEDQYTSSGYDDAENRIDLKVDSGIGEIRIVEYNR
jgi:hypothetical protein